MRRTHLMMTDAGWDKFKEHMQHNTQLALAEGAYRHARRVQEQPFVVAPPSDPNSCPGFCPTCHGMNYSVHPDTGEVLECPQYRARLDHAGIPDPSRNLPEDPPAEFWND